MVFIFILLTLIILINIYAILLLFSTIKIKIIHLEFNNILEPKSKFDYKIQFGIYFLNKVKIFSINLSQKSKIFQKINLPPIQTDIKYNNLIFTSLKELHLQIEKFNLKLDLGTQDVLFTTFIIFIISTVISIILPHLVSNKDYKKIFYKITPLQNGKNCLNINFDCIINVKMVHIINIIYVYLKRKGRDKNGRTSNRRFNDNSYEQYSRYGRCKYNYRRAD